MRIDTLLTNARIRTMDPAHPVAHTLAITNGFVVAVDEDARDARPDRVLDLGGQVVLPGFHDAHMHFSVLGQDFTQLDLAPERVGGLDALYAEVERFAATLEPGRWVVGHGYDQNKLGGHPHRRVLDRIAGGRPVYLVHNSKHMAVANTAAFAAAGHPDPDAVHDVAGGVVVREGGEATGLLQEKALALVNHALRPVAQEPLVEGLAAASEWALRHGLTSVTEPGIAGQSGIGHGPSDLRAFQTARDLGLLRVRATLFPFVDALHPLGAISSSEEGFGLDLGMRSGLGDDFVRVGAVKIASDGSLIGRTAAMCCDYHDSPGNSGLLQWSEKELFELIDLSHRNGWQVATHAIGDYALDVTLDAYEAAQRRTPRPDARHRIEHVAVASDEQVDRIIRGGVVPVPQGRFISRLGDGFISALGPERAELAYRMRSFVDAGVVLPGSSDAPVVPGEPLHSIHDMVNRTTAAGVVINPGERLTVEQALRAYTVGSAYADRQEHRKGTLAAGYLADLVVLSDDPLCVPAQRLRELQVGATMVGGELLHDAGVLERDA
ncbi:amidohydrolase [Nocardiopsis sp. HUAS JQ3]|uniref:amidohydrolase n=1 Tax=Nocardiopsis sp. HUAS JQ3 TaxID=3061629 RepID=UPI0023A9DE6C|nr:amidohydrolase [Nocardiopsis sp. HUAS JQ3]WDZ93279.1 amidohydrolase [Nocardiopsis sp. HUAS JQ3]